MASIRKRVVRSDLWIAPAFDERLAGEPDISLDVFSVRGSSAAAWDLLSADTHSRCGQRARSSARAKNSCGSSSFAAEM